MSETFALRSCPFCGSKYIEIERDSRVFHGADFGNRYPSKVSKQSHGFRGRCEECGCQTCYWHYESEVAEAWNRRTP